MTGKIETEVQGSWCCLWLVRLIMPVLALAEIAPSARVRALSALGAKWLVKHFFVAKIVPCATPSPN
jgi:hypothetical protein